MYFESLKTVALIILFILYFKFSEGEIASPYVFICDNARQLNIKFPMKGKAKVCKYKWLVYFLIFIISYVHLCGNWYDKEKALWQ